METFLRNILTLCTVLLFSQIEISYAFEKHCYQNLDKNSKQNRMLEKIVVVYEDFWINRRNYCKLKYK